MSRLSANLFFTLCLLGIGAGAAYAQTERPPTRAEEIRQTLSPTQPDAAAAERHVGSFGLEDGTVIKLRLLRDLSSARTRSEEPVDFEVIEAVNVAGLIVVRRGARAAGQVIDAWAARQMGRTGRIGVKLDWVELANGERGRLRAISHRSDGSRGAQVATRTAIAAAFFFPAAPFFLLKKGKDAVLPQGTLVTAFIDGELMLERAKFQ